MGKRIDKRCLDCGKMMHQVDPHTSLCPDCRALHAQARKRLGHVSVFDKFSHAGQYYKAPEKTTTAECQGCYYWRGFNAFSECCCYILIEGHSRGCEPGRNCKHRNTTRKD